MLLFKSERYLIKVVIKQQRYVKTGACQPRLLRKSGYLPIYSLQPRYSPAHLCCP